MTTRKRWTITSNKFLSLEQISKLIDYLLTCRDLAIARNNNKQAVKDYYIVRGLLESGARVQEFCDLKNFDVSGLRLDIRKGKGGKPRTILLTRSTGNLFREWLVVKERLGFTSDPQEPLFPSRFKKHYSTRGIQDRIKIIFAAAGLPEHLSTHSLRHTYCSLLLSSKKVGLATVRDNMGHSTISITDLYSHALGNLENVELYSPPTEEITETSELQSKPSDKKASHFVKHFLRKTKFK